MPEGESPELSISDYFQSPDIFVEDLELAVNNGQCARALRYIAAYPGRAPGEFMDLVMGVIADLPKYEETQREEIRQSLIAAGHSLIDYVDGKSK